MSRSFGSPHIRMQGLGDGNLNKLLAFTTSVLHQESKGNILLLQLDFTSLVEVAPSKCCLHLS